MNGCLGLRAPNGSLYLVTGADKATNWCLAMYPNAMGKTGTFLGFTSTDISTTSVTSQFSCHGSGSVEARTCNASEEGRFPNQCVFICGYKLALSESLYERSFVGPVKAFDIVTLGPSVILTKGRSIPGTDTSRRWFLWLLGRERMQSQGSAAMVPDPTSNRDVVLEVFPNMSEV